MSRLYYEGKHEQQPIQRRGNKATTNESGTMHYMEKVAKLIPSEVVGAYVALVGFIPLVRFKCLHIWLSIAAFVLCLCLTPIYLNRQAEPGRPKNRHIIISSIAFVVWAYAVAGRITFSNLYDPAIASIALVVFSLISGFIPLQK